MQISVIIPVYNTEKYLEESILSALGQKEVDEIIVIDDGSVDNSFGIATELAEKNSKIKVFIHSGHINKGPGASRNLGIKLAKNEWIAFLDADDIYLANRFKESANLSMKKENIKFIHGAAMFYGNYQSTAKKYNNELIYFDYNGQFYDAFEKYFIGKHGWTTLNTCLFHKSCFEIVGYFDENLILNQDTDLILRVLKNLPSCKLSTRIISKARQHNNRRTLKEDLSKIYKKKFYQKWFDLFLDQKWSKALNRSFLNRYMQYENQHYPKIKSEKLRKGLKVIILMGIILKKPKVLYKIL